MFHLNQANSNRGDEAIKAYRVKQYSPYTYMLHSLSENIFSSPTAAHATDQESCPKH